MSSRRAKNIRMREKRAAWEEEIRQRGLEFLSKEQTRRAEEKKAADEKVLERKKRTSKKLAKQHQKSSQQSNGAVKVYKPMEQGRSTLAKMAGKNV